MATILLIVIYIAFIGLGIPDSLFGTAWPAIYNDFQTPVYMGSIVSAIISGGTIFCSLFSARIIKFFGTAIISLISTIITVIALIGFRFSPNVYWMFLFSFPLGIGAGAIDAALNNYVALYHKVIHMNFLHCFYGIGVTVGPFFLSFTLSKGDGWRSGYEIVTYIQITIALILLLSLPLWKKVNHKHNTLEEVQEIVPFSKLIKHKKVRLVCLLFLTSCGIEYVCGIWGSTFLVEARNMELGIAAGFMTFYYFGIAFGRFLAGILSKWFMPLKIVITGQVFIGISILILILPVSSIISGICLFFIGFGIGPIFPNLLHITPICFGQKLSASVMSIQMTASYIGILGCPFIFGLMAQSISAGLFSIYLLFIFVIMMIAMILFNMIKNIEINEY